MVMVTSLIFSPSFQSLGFTKRTLKPKLREIFSDCYLFFYIFNIFFVCYSMYLIRLCFCIQQMKESTFAILYILMKIGTGCIGSNYTNDNLRIFKVIDENLLSNFFF